MILHKKPIKAQTGTGTEEDPKRKAAREEFIAKYTVNQSSTGVTDDATYKNLVTGFNEDWDAQQLLKQRTVNPSRVYVGEEDTYNYAGKTFTPVSAGVSKYNNLKDDEAKRNFIWGSYGTGKSPGLPTQDEINNSKGGMRYTRTKDLMSMPDEYVPQQLHYLLKEDKVGVYQGGGILSKKNKNSSKIETKLVDGKMQNVTTHSNGNVTTTSRGTYATPKSNYEASMRAAAEDKKSNKGDSRTMIQMKEMERKSEEKKKKAEEKKRKEKALIRTPPKKKSRWK